MTVLSFTHILALNCVCVVSVCIHIYFVCVGVCDAPALSFFCIINRCGLHIHIRMHIYAFPDFKHNCSNGRAYLQLYQNPMMDFGADAIFGYCII